MGYFYLKLYFLNFILPLDPVASGLQTAASTSFGGSDHDDLSIDVERVIEFSSDEGKSRANFCFKMCRIAVSRFYVNHYIML